MKAIPMKEVEKLLEKYKSMLGFEKVKVQDRADDPMFFVISAKVEAYQKIVQDLESLVEDK